MRRGRRAAAIRVMPHGPILFVIPARGGSRRIPRKNLRLVGGIPLTGWAARIARAAASSLDGGPHRVVCTTDDPEIAAVAAAWGAEVLDRPAALATDEATSVDVALHALDVLEAAGGAFATLVLLQPTSPLTDPEDVVDAVRRHRVAGGTSVTSVVRGHPATWHHGLAADGMLTPAGAVHGEDTRLAGAFYVIAPAALRTSRRFVDPGRTIALEVAGDRAIDVDEPEDLVVAEALLAVRRPAPVEIGPAVVGAGRTFVIAEAGVNHNGEPELALRLVTAAAEAGADAVKFQTFDPAALAVPGAPTAAYQRRAGADAADQHELLKRLTLPIDAWPAIQARANEVGLVFLSTPFDDGSADVLDRLRVPAFKVGSGELTNTPFIARLARRGRPLLISTGMADMVEVAAAVDTVRANGNPPLALFHCVSSYPATASDANLRAMETLRRAFGVPVGWSDHTIGIEVAQAAVALGASLVEKHLTLDRTLPGPDHAASVELTDFAAMVEGIRSIEAALGSGIKVATEAERNVADVARRSLYWRVSRPAGHTVTADDVAALRPAAGISPSRLDTLVGQRTHRPVTAGERVDWADVDAPA